MFWRQFLLNNNRYFEIQYEDLVQNPDQLQSMIARELPTLEMTRKFSTFPNEAFVPHSATIAMNGLRPVSPDSIGRWRADPARAQSCLAAYPNFKKLITTLGYSADGDKAAQAENSKVIACHGYQSILDDASIKQRLALFKKDAADVMRNILRKPKTPTLRSRHHD